MAYVCADGEYHVSKAMSFDGSIGAEWLQDVPQDPIVLFAAKTVGIEKLRAMASKADDTSEWWSSALRWSIVGELLHRALVVLTHASAHLFKKPVRKP